MKSIRSVDENGNIWYKNENGDLHREDGPSVEWTDGGKEWWINGLRHREDGPSVEWTNNGEVCYCLNGFTYYKQDWEEEVMRIRLERLKRI